MTTVKQGVWPFPEILAVGSASGQVKRRTAQSNGYTYSRFAGFHVAPWCPVPPLHVVHDTAIDPMRVALCFGAAALDHSRNETRTASLPHHGQFLHMLLDGLSS
jgi:hypothetical protein